MKAAYVKSRWITLALCLVAIILLVVRLIPHRGHSGAGSSRATHSGSAPYLGLRSLALEATRANFGLGPGASPTQPFAVVIDRGDLDGTITTIIAIADGSASVYRSNGSASIGGGQKHESIRNAALKTVETAAVAQPLMHRTNEYPLPSRGQVFFYAVTDAGVFAATVAEDDLVGNGGPFSSLGAAAQNIVSEYQRETPAK